MSFKLRTTPPNYVVSRSCISPTLNRIMSSYESLEISQSTKKLLKVFVMASLVKFVGSTQFSAVSVNTGEPNYDASTGVIVSVLTCVADTDNATDNYGMQWIALDGSMVINVTTGFKSPKRISSTEIRTTGCTSNLTLHVIPKASLPRFQCQLFEKRANNLIATSALADPNVLIAVQPGRSNITVFEGTSPSITCPLGNNLPPSAIESMQALWWSKSSTLPSTSLTLRLPNVTRADEGWIECKLIGNKSHHTLTREVISWVYLSVKGPPPKPHLHLGPNVKCNLSERVPLAWNWPNGTYTKNITAEINCTFLKGIIQYPLDSNAPAQILLNATDTNGYCQIQLRNPAGVSGYSEPLLICRDIEKTSTYLSAIASVGVAIVILVAVAIWKIPACSRFKKHLPCFSQKPSPPEKKTEAETHNQNSEGIKAILTVCQQTHQVVQDIAGNVAPITDNGANETISGRINECSRRESNKAESDQESHASENARDESEDYRCEYMPERCAEDRPGPDGESEV